jgi:hypothetical protein
MNTFILAIEIAFGVVLFLLFMLIIFSFLKFLKKDYFPNWKFLDYFSVGYFEYLYTRYIKKQ